MLMTAALRDAARTRANALAIVCGDERRSWLDTQRRVAAIAGALRASGIGPGDAVATLAMNGSRYFETLLAIWWAGAVVVPLNTRLTLDELRHIVEHSQARALLTDETFATTGAALRGSLPQLELVAMLDDAYYGELTSHTQIDDASAGADELAGIFYTGGTTGLPKGVELTHRNFAVSARNMQRELLHDESTIYLHASPLFHLADLSIGLGVMLGVGGHSFIGQFTPALFYERLRCDGVTHLQLVPTMLAAVLDAPQRDDRLLAQIRSISYGAAPVSQPLLARLLDAFPNARIQQFYGLTEVCGACVILRAERHVLSGPLAGKLLAAGETIDGFEVRIADVDQLPCATGEAGEVQMRGAAVMRGYWREPDKTRDAFADGWLRSGDIGRIDEDGFLYVVDRLKDMIISGGENIYCAEVENAICRHPAVLACAVFGVPDTYWGERVHAVIVPREGVSIDVDQINALCRQQIAGYKVPRSYEIRNSGLPLSGVGKVQKNLLRAEWLAAHGDTQ
ncbi:AMP-binding protein [Burkholderia pseudomallei]|uniref:class I adenylate-forming enzyme family protein n=1 Tax=Burkholderia pseudomallei TaxID=28450 RepID=UPI001AD64793|nr:AMP-binding protein [Burkholderia pseudomallei]MBO7934035.1 AMP-binding protein [Burkholderia pseudomallei]